MPPKSYRTHLSGMWGLLRALPNPGSQSISQHSYHLCYYQCTGVCLLHSRLTDTVLWARSPGSRARPGTRELKDNQEESNRGIQAVSPNFSGCHPSLSSERTPLIIWVVSWYSFGRFFMSCILSLLCFLFAHFVIKNCLAYSSFFL